ncbi:GGDEF domain-containing protein [Crossiella sp. SN42]|uniref:diguanylate cyclase domain-containing protein n=1 Tax=Crossiella sp. SN42 TaxID=2944808 RepID=UPI00207CE98D|nr:diguanylate cyclase [Crossiella sp. SN42]MCO1575603.1 GGDEF domain-containing protein [Crossiella sp. SN42]
MPVLVAVVVLLGVLILLCAALSCRLAEEQRAVSALRHQLHHAEHDELTGLPGRRLWLRQAVAQLPTMADPVLVIADLNRLKWINDRYGYQAGDDLISAFAQAATITFAHEFGTPAWGRLGGDEFIALINVPSAQHMRVRRAVAQFEVEFTNRVPGIDGVRVASAAFGVAHTDSASHLLEGQRPRQGLRCLMFTANSALHEAKELCRSGEQTAAVFTEHRLRPHLI